MHNILGINYFVRIRRTKYIYTIRKYFSGIYNITYTRNTHVFKKQLHSHKTSPFMFLLLFIFANVQKGLILPGRRYLRLNFQVNDLPQNVQQNS